jgi:hypothetical protein
LPKYNLAGHRTCTENISNRLNAAKLLGSMMLRKLFSVCYDYNAVLRTRNYIT